MGHTQSPEHNIGGGGAERSHESVFNATSSAADTSLFNAAYGGLGRDNTDAANNGRSGSGTGMMDFVKGAEETIDKVPDQMAAAGGEMIGGNGGARAWESASNGSEVTVPPVDEALKKDPTAHAGMYAMTAGLADGKALGLSNTKDAIRRGAEYEADRWIQDKTSNA